MVRKCSHLGPHQVQVALPSGVQILIPERMLDEDPCRGMEIVEHPTLSITALLSLRDLIDAQPRTPEPSGTIASEASSPGGASDEPTAPGSFVLGLRLRPELLQYSPDKVCTCHFGRMRLWLMRQCVFA